MYCDFKKMRTVNKFSSNDLPHVDMFLNIVLKILAFEVVFDWYCSFPAEKAVS